MKFLEAIRFGFKNYFNFRGKVGRSTFWYWALFLFIFFNIFRLLPGAVSSYVQGAFVLGALSPTLALMIKRLRDAGFSPFLMLIWILPVPVGLNLMSSIYASNFAPDPIAEGSAGYIPVHLLATGFVGGLTIFFFVLIEMLVMAILWAQPSKTM